MMRCPAMLTMLFVAAVCSGCPTSSSTPPSTSSTGPRAVEGVRSMGLTAPWKDMKLSINGGVVVNSTPKSLLVRFPVTPASAFKGLAATLQDELVAHGWIMTAEQRAEDEVTVLFELPDGQSGDLNLAMDDGRTVVSVGIVD